LEASAKAKPDLFLAIGCNPRFEASTLNVRLRKLVLQSSVSSTTGSDSVSLAYIGQPMDLTYPSSHIGTGSKDLSLLSEGRHN
jgi:NADH-quinone oxidoreductase subunit G